MIQNSAKSPFIAYLLATGLGFALPAFAANSHMPNSIKCWTNKQGVRECGTSVPPEYSQEGHEVLNSQGRVIKEEERAKTPEELKEEARKAAERKKLELKKKEAARRDRVLLATYTSVGDIEHMRDEQLKALDSTIKVTKARNDKIQQDLDKRIDDAAARERSGKKPSKELLADIKSLRSQIARNQKYVEDRQKEKKEIQQQYEDKINRFKELKAQGR